MGTALRFRNGKKNLSSLVYRPPQNLKLGIFTSQLCRDGNEKKCTKKKKRVMRVQSRCFAQQTYYHFDVLIAFAVAVVNTQWRIQVSASGGPSPPYFSTKLRPEGRKNFIWRPPSSYLRVWMIAPPSPSPLISRSGSCTKPCLICFRRTYFFVHGSRTKSYEAVTTINSIEIM